MLLRPLAAPGRQQVVLMPHQRMLVHADRIQRQVDFNSGSSAEARQKPSNLGPRPAQQPQQRRPQFERPQQAGQPSFQGPKPAGQPQPQRFNPHPAAQKPAAPAPLPDFGSGFFLFFFFHFHAHSFNIHDTPFTFSMGRFQNT